MLLLGIPMQRMLKLFRCWDVYWEGRLLKTHGFERKKSDKCDEEARGTFVRLIDVFHPQAQHKSWENKLTQVVI